MARIIKAVAKQMASEESRKEILSLAMDAACAIAATATCITLLQLC